MGVVAVFTLLVTFAWFAIVGVSTAAAAPAWNYGSEDPLDGSAVSSTTVMIQATVSDTVPINTAGTLMTINGAPVAPLTEPVDSETWLVSYRATGLQPGENIVEMVARNSLGESELFTFTFYVDLPPVITSFTPADGAYLTNSLTQTVRVTVTDLDMYGLPVPFAGLPAPILQIDGLAPAAMQRDNVGQTFFRTRTFSSSDIPVPLTVTANNQAGNPGSTVAVHYIVVTTQADVTAPVIDPTSLVPAPGSTVAPPPAIKAGVTDNRPGNVTVSYIVDGTTVYSQPVAQGTVTYVPAPDLTDGSHDVTATAVDAAGNAATPRHWTFTVESGTAVSHTTTTDFTSCAKCHNAEIDVQHAPAGDVGAGCTKCHGATAPVGWSPAQWQRVKDAIRDNNTECEACHSMNNAGHQALHNGGTGAPDCLECHKSNISEEHENNCDKCHKSTDPDVVKAIADGLKKCSSCHVIHPPGFYRIRTDYYNWGTQPGPRNTGTPLGDVGSNPANPGVHANYLATTAKCGMCHSVHRANGNGTKLLPTDNTTCACCHVGTTAITAKLVTWTPYSTTWVPEVDSANPLYPVGGDAWMAATPAQRVAAIDNKADAGGAVTNGGPHNDSAVDLIADGYWDGTGTTPEIGYDAGHRYGCFTRRCHASNPHGANSSKIKLFAAKLLFNDTPAQDDAESGKTGGTYGGLDASYDNLGASDAAVQRFVDANPSVVRATADGNIEINKNATGWRAPDANETHALVAGLTCGRPSNAPTGEDECHAEASYAIVDKGVKEGRNKATRIAAGPAYRTDNTGAEAEGYGGNDSRALKTGHVAGTFAAAPDDASYAAINGCVSCHDQTDGANLVFGNYTFPHGQAALGATNLHLADGSNNTSGSAGWTRARLWMGYGANTGAALTAITVTNEKAYDGNCLKCHRDGSGNGIGLTK